MQKYINNENSLRFKYFTIDEKVNDRRDFMNTTMERKAATLRLLGATPEERETTLDSIRNSNDPKVLDRLLAVPVVGVYEAIVKNYYTEGSTLEKAREKISSSNVSDSSKRNLLMNIYIHPHSSRQTSQAARAYAESLREISQPSRIGTGTGTIGKFFSGLLRSTPAVRQETVSACGD